MIEHLFTCDKCGKKARTNQGFWTIAIVVKERDGNNYFYSSGVDSRLTRDWCRECTEKAGLLPVKEIKPEEVKQLTLEDLVRQIVHDEVGG